MEPLYVDKRLRLMLQDLEVLEDQEAEAVEALGDVDVVEIEADMVAVKEEGMVVIVEEDMEIEEVDMEEKEEDVDTGAVEVETGKEAMVEVNIEKNNCWQIAYSFN